jgi:hypothetical protein
MLFIDDQAPVYEFYGSLQRERGFSSTTSARSSIIGGNIRFSYLFKPSLLVKRSRVLPECAPGVLLLIYSRILMCKRKYAAVRLKLYLFSFWVKIRGGKQTYPSSRQP